MFQDSVQWNSRLHRVCWVSARFRRWKVWSQCGLLPLLDYGELLAFSVVLYKNIILVLTATECLLIVGVASRSSISRNHFWLFRRKKTQLCDSVVRNCSELKSQVFMNGNLAFGRCNTYFNVCFWCLCIVQCHGYWSVSSIEVINSAFSFKLFVRLFLFMMGK